MLERRTGVKWIPTMAEISIMAPIRGIPSTKNESSAYRTCRQETIVANPYEWYAIFLLKLLLSGKGRTQS